VILPFTHYPPPFLQNYYKIFIYVPSFSPLPRLIIIFLFKKLVGTNIRNQMKIMSGEKRELPMIQIRLLKKRRREVKVDSKLGGR